MLNRAAEHLEEILVSRFTPFPKWGDPAWKELCPEAQEYLVGRAELLAEKEWNVLPASMYLDFHRNGNRSRYEKAYYEPRERLLQLIVAECIESKGRFIDPIIDGLWAVCEETSWIVPAHDVLSNSRTLTALPDFNREMPFIDLCAADTGALLAWIHYLLGDRLNEECPLLTARIEKEVRRRVMDPFMACDDMWWMGLTHNNPVNNWNPWINSGVMITFLFLEKDRQRQIEGLKKVARSAQRFLDFYHEDGGCDEGPVYFNVAGASLLDILEIFYDATEGRMNLYGEKLIANIADYIRHVHIDGPYFVNFADASTCLRDVASGLLLRTGKMTGCEELAEFARTVYQDGNCAKPWHMNVGRNWMIFRKLKSLFTYDAEDLKPRGSLKAGDHYFDGIQVAVARTDGGLFFAAKGGHNAESHNHNDIGNYMLYAKGKPCVVDAGVGLYSKKTFSDQRYTIWSMQSGYHNTAIINGCDQREGKEYTAHSTTFKSSAEAASFATNIEKAYPAEASLQEYRREFTLDKAENTLTVTDRLEMTECTSHVVLPLLCYEQPGVGEGAVSLGGLTLRFDPTQFTASFEEIRLDDPENPITSWGKNTLYRLLLTRSEKKTADQWTITYALD